MSKHLRSLDEEIASLPDDEYRQGLQDLIVDVRRTDDQWELMLAEQRTAHARCRARSWWMPILLAVGVAALLFYCTLALVNGYITIGHTVTYLSKEPKDFFFYLVWPATIAVIFASIAIREMKSNFYLRFGPYDIQDRAKTEEVRHFLLKQKLRDEGRIRRAPFLVIPFFGLGGYVLLVDISESVTSGIYTISRSSRVVDVTIEPLHYWLRIGLESFGALLFIGLALAVTWGLIRKWHSRSVRRVSAGESPNSTVHIGLEQK